MASIVIPNRRQANTNPIPEANTKPSKAARPGRSDTKSAARAAVRTAPRAGTSPERRGANAARERLLEDAEALLEPLSSLEMLCAADESMENPILFMNRAALETMSLNHRRLN